MKRVLVSMHIVDKSYDVSLQAKLIEVNDDMEKRTDEHTCPVQTTYTFNRHPSPSFQSQQAA